MLRETLRIACAQCALPASPAAALQNSIAAIDDAAARGARIVAFPEAYVPGYPWPGRPAPEVDAAFLEAAYQEVREAAKRASIAVVLGTERFVEGRRHLTALVVDAAGEVLGWQDKVQLDPYE
nr:nitrilase-related carbon-nitrogen hydrolase [Planctomycetota bacterium]